MSFFVKFCAFEQEFGAVVFVYFPAEPYGPGCGFIENYFEQNNSNARSAVEGASSVRKSCTTQPSASQDAW